MPVYDDLRPEQDFEERDYARIFPRLTKPERRRIIGNIFNLKDALAAVPARRTERNLLVASWNIKEFGHTTQRLPEAYFYMAEIISAFDLVAVQEIKSTLHDFRILMRVLGDDWRYVINDITGGRDGNSERSGYLYNRRRVSHAGLAGEIGLWPGLLDDHPRPPGAPAVAQLKRAPYITGFTAGWKTFALINLHLHPSSGDDDVALRREETRLLLAALKEKADSDGLWTRNLVLVGDMNFYESKDGGTIRMIEQAGYRQCGGLVGLDTNASRSDAYDRMFFSTNEYFRFAEDAAGRESGGVIDFFDSVYRDEGWRPYRPTMLDQYGGAKDLANDQAALESYYRNTWRRNQMSDHFPIWAEIEIDDSRSFLQSKLDAL